MGREGRERGEAGGRCGMVVEEEGNGIKMGRGGK
jgi:hypothetical protein